MAPGELDKGSSFPRPAARDEGHDGVDPVSPLGALCQLPRRRRGRLLSLRRLQGRAAAEWDPQDSRPLLLPALGNDLCDQPRDDDGSVSHPPPPSQVPLTLLCRGGELDCPPPPPPPLPPPPPPPPHQLSFPRQVCTRWWFEDGITNGADWYNRARTLYINIIAHRYHSHHLKKFGDDFIRQQCSPP